ncbi:TPR-domain containing protein [Chitinispirillum alkaliphilum]|nr:TPR-domain containing protein [Chitinispirillum alkaliphilum]
MKKIFVFTLFLFLCGCASVKEGVVLEQSPELSDSEEKAKEKIGDPEEVTGEQPELSQNLSRASSLMLQASENYLALNPESPKRPEVIAIKASLYYNNRMFDKSRSVYRKIVQEYPQTNYSFEAIRMIAQAYYEEQRFEDAQSWYRKLKDAVPEGEDSREAIIRIAESIFRQAEQYEQQENFANAAAQYERVAIEFPDVKFADVSLLNAGLAYERQMQWSRAILVFQRLINRYENSTHLPRAQFRIAKCYEKLNQWDNAAESYLRLVARYPQSELAPSAIYNAGFSFENSGKFREAAATFERMVQLYPEHRDAADVLFRAGELYGTIQDWESAERVTDEFSRRFGNDADRIIQALCMRGIALYMQNREAEAIRQFSHTVSTFRRMSEPSGLNAYYAAKAQFTIGEIYHERMNSVELVLPRARYRTLLREKNELLEEAVDSYTSAIQFGVLEWTTRGIFQIGQAHEDFANGIFKQQRPVDVSLDEQLTLELGIAEAVERFYIDKALYYHERNVEIGIREKLEDEYISRSRSKITALPFMAAENYKSLARIATDAETVTDLEGMALMARKFQLLQKIAPYQQRAIDLFLTVLEMGSTYSQIDEFYNMASRKISSTSLSVGDNHFEIVRIARDAPMPEAFDRYERFVYMTQLAGQVERYESQALDAYLKGLKIAEAYGIEGVDFRLIRERIATLLFERGRYFDLLANKALYNPPFPSDISEHEKEEYVIRFEDVGLQLQEQALDIYSTVLEFAKNNYADGEYLKHAYVRLFQENPAAYGERVDTVITIRFSSGRQWRVTDHVQDESGWLRRGYDDSYWDIPHRVAAESLVNPDIADNVPSPMWYGQNYLSESEEYIPAETVYFRRMFSLEDVPYDASFSMAAFGDVTAFLNDEKLPLSRAEGGLLRADLKGQLRRGNNMLAVKISKGEDGEFGFLPLMSAMVQSYKLVPRLPGHSEITPEQTRKDVYQFPEISSNLREEK